MENLEAAATIVGIITGLGTIGWGIYLAFRWLRARKVIKRWEYNRLKGIETEHQKCVAERERLSTLDNWGREIRDGSAHRLAKEPDVDTEFDPRGPVRNRR